MLTNFHAAVAQFLRQTPLPYKIMGGKAVQAWLNPDERRLTDVQRVWIRTQDWDITVPSADSRRARLLCGRITTHARARVEELACLNLEVSESEHGRPSPRIGKNGHSYASRGHDDAEVLARFAHEVSSFMEDKMGELGVSRVFLFAPARFLGALRKAIPNHIADRVVAQEAELAQLSAARLAGHPEILRLIDRPRAG